MARRATSCCASVWLVIGLWTTACGGSPAAESTTPVTVTAAQDPDAPPTEARTPAPLDEGRFRCTADVRALGPIRTGEATGPSAEGLDEQARRDACKQLWESDKVDCNDDARVATVSKQTNVTVIHDQFSQTVRLLLRSVGETYRGVGRADSSGNEACLRAVDRACSQAPEGVECSGRGLHCWPSEDDPHAWHCSPSPPQRNPRTAPSPFGA